MARPRKEDQRDIRQATLDAALDLFAQNGFHGTSMREIARAVGVRESALYHHFPSKEGILEALAQKWGPANAERLAQMDWRSMVEAQGTEKFLRLVAHTAIEIWATPQEQKFSRIMLAEGPRQGVSEHLHPRTNIHRGFEHLTTLFKELVEQKRIRPGDPEVLVLAFMGPLVSMRLMYLVMTGGRPDYRKLRAMVDGHLDFFWAAVAP